MGRPILSYWLPYANLEVSCYIETIKIFYTLNFSVLSSI